MNWTPIVVAICSLGISSYFTVLFYLMKSKIERMDKDIENLQKEQKEFKENYLDRFDKVNRAINESKLEIIERIHDLKTNTHKK